MNYIAVLNKENEYQAQYESGPTPKDAIEKLVKSQLSVFQKSIGKKIRIEVFNALYDFESDEIPELYDVIGERYSVEYGYSHFTDNNTTLVIKVSCHSFAYQV
jgi:hypothetical protein